MNLRATTLAVVTLLVASSAGGCYRQIVYPGTRAYDERVRTLDVTPARAAELAAAAQQSAPNVRDNPGQRALWWGHRVPSSPTAIIDRTYLFESDEMNKLQGLPLTGYYVDGTKGTVTYRQGDFLEAGLWTGRMPTEVPDDAWDSH